MDYSLKTRKAIEAMLKTKANEDLIEALEVMHARLGILEQAQRDTADFLEAQTPSESTTQEPCKHPLVQLSIDFTSTTGAVLECSCHYRAMVPWRAKD